MLLVSHNEQLAEQQGSEQLVLLLQKQSYSTPKVLPKSLSTVAAVYASVPLEGDLVHLTHPPQQTDHEEHVRSLLGVLAVGVADNLDLSSHLA